MVPRDQMLCLKRSPLGAALLLALLLAVLGPFTAHGASYVGQAQPPDCRFVLGFSTLRDLILEDERADRVGQCKENEYHALSGDGVQWTSTGVLVWRKANNWTGFTDGQSSWVSGPYGLQKRGNAERFPWESAAGKDAVSYLKAPTGGSPQPVEDDEAIRLVYVIHAANGGSTFNRYFGDLAGLKLYAVSLYPERSVVVYGKEASLEVLRQFIARNRDLLQDPRVSVGTWYNKDNHMTYLDLSATIPDRQQAVELGRKYNQIAIFDLSTFEEIDTGGTGEKIPNLPPEANRLPGLGVERSGLHYPSGRVPRAA